MAVGINRALNLVLPVEREDGSEVYVHSVPIGREIFERYYRSIARMLSDLAVDGIAHLGPRLALLALRDAAKAVNDWEGDDGVENGLLGEIKRLTSVIVPKPEGGWQTIPYDVAVGQRVLSEEDQREVMGALVFFISNCALAPKNRLEEILNGVFSPFGAVFTSQTATAYAASLQTSTPAESSGAAPEPDMPKVVQTPSSVPS